MLATELAHGEGESGLADSKLNFVSFTPGTSFKLGHSAGRGREREVLFQLLDPLVGPRTALMNLLQGGIARRDKWRGRLENYPRPIDDTIRQRFEAAFHERPDLQNRLRELLDTWFRRYRTWPAEARHPRDRVISELRRVLAGACVKALEPDLVILDEFQRFKSLLDTRDTERDPAAGLAQELFQAEAHDGKRVRTLLLSATPYKLYTADAEIEHEDHYEDFLATTRFLLGDDEARVEEVKYQLSRFGAALRRAGRCGLRETRQGTPFRNRKPPGGWRRVALGFSRLLRPRVRRLRPRPSIPNTSPSVTPMESGASLKMQSAGVSRRSLTVTRRRGGRASSGKRRQAASGSPTTGTVNRSARPCVLEPVRWRRPTFQRGRTPVPILPFATSRS